MKKRLAVSVGMIGCLLAFSLGCGSAGGGGGGETAASAGYFAPARYSLPANTLLTVRLRTDVIGDQVSVGQPIDGEVTSNVLMDGHILIPAGSRVTGSVTAVKPAKRFGGQAMVAVGFDSVVLSSGDSVPIEGGMAAYADKETAKDTGAIIGGTVGGAILGKVIGKDTKDAVTGAVIGGGIGTAIASRKGDEAHLPAGTTAQVQTLQSVKLPAA